MRNSARTTEFVLGTSKRFQSRTVCLFIVTLSHIQQPKPLVTSGATKVTTDGRYSVIGYAGDAPGDDACEVEAHNFTYVDAYGFDKDEVLEASVVGRSLPPHERCLLATRLATAFFPPR